MFEIGAILLAAAQNYVMLIIGRCFLGVAVRGLRWLLAEQSMLHLLQGSMSSVFVHGSVQISFASVSVPMFNR